MPAQSPELLDHIDWLESLYEGLDPDQRWELYDKVREFGDDIAAFRYEWERQQAAEHADQVEGLAPWVPLPHQVPPPGDDWRGWILLGGRGSGKSAAATRWLVEHIHGPPCDPNIPGGHRGIIIAPTLEDGVLSVFEGPSGIRRHDPTATLATVVGGTVVRFANGVEIPIIGAFNEKNADRVRARGNTCCAMIEEAAAVPALREAWDNLELGLRLGPNPRVVMSTTPKPRKVLRDIVDDEDVAVTSGTIHDNPHLDERFRARMQRRFAGTRKEAQELRGVLMDEVVGALWTMDAWEKGRLKVRNPKRTMTAVGVDPSGSTGADADETGVIVVDGWMDTNRNPCVCAVADYTQPDGDPAKWAKAAIQAAIDYDADFIVGEKNYGGEMVKSTLEQAMKDAVKDPDHPLKKPIPIKVVTASKGKVRRAEPIAMMFDPTPTRGYIVGSLPELENQACTFIDEPGADSPDRMDAFVWAATEVVSSWTVGERRAASQAAVRGRRRGR